MIGDSLRDRIQVELSTRTRTATGHHDVWVADTEMWGLVIAVGMSSLARFGQLRNSETTHLLVFRDRQTWQIDTTRFIHGSDTYEPLERPLYLGQVQNITTIECRVAL